MSVRSMLAGKGGLMHASVFLASLRTAVVMEKMMAESKVVASGTVDPLERQWIRECVKAKIQQLRRSREKEMPGSDIWTLRLREIEYLESMLSRYA